MRHWYPFFLVCISKELQDGRWSAVLEIDKLTHSNSTASKRHTKERNIEIYTGTPVSAVAPVELQYGMWTVVPIKLVAQCDVADSLYY